MRAAAAGPLRGVSPQGRAGPGRSGGDEADRRTLPGDAVLWIAQDGGGVARGGTRDQPQEGSPSDAPNGAGGPGAQARHQQSLAAEQDLSLSVARPDDRSAQP